MSKHKLIETLDVHLADKERDLTAYEEWMVGSNLRTAREEGRTPREQAVLLRANGYDRVARAVEDEPEEVDALEKEILEFESWQRNFILSEVCYNFGVEEGRKQAYQEIESHFMKGDNYEL